MLFSKKYNYLKKGLNKKSGKNFRGKITVYHKGGGNKNLYRFIDFKHVNKQGKVVDTLSWSYNAPSLQGGDQYLQ